MAHRGRHRYMYMASVRDQGCGYGKHFEVSFGLDDRYLFLTVTKCYRNIQELATLSQKTIADPLGRKETITLGLRHCQSPSLSQDMLTLLLLCSG